MQGNFEFKHVERKELFSSAEGALQFIEQLRSLTSDLIGSMEYQTQALPEKLSVVRARHWPSSEWPSLRDLGPPQAEKIQNYGRCNKPNQPIGYCSLYEDSALSEINAEVEQCYVISTFILPKGTILLPIGEHDYYRRTGSTYLGSLETKNKEFYEGAA